MDLMFLKHVMNHLNSNERRYKTKEYRTFNDIRVIITTLKEVKAEL